MEDTSELDKKMEEIDKILQDVLIKLPKDSTNRIQWLVEKSNDIYTELSKSGLDLYSIIGMLDSIKLRFTGELENTYNFKYKLDINNKKLFR